MIKRPALLILVLILIVASIVYLQRPDVVIEPSTGTEVLLGPIGNRVPADVGQKVQDFALADYEGTVHRFRDYEGSPLILNFWATWCLFCIEEMPLFEEVFQDYEDQGLAIIAINRAESVEQAKKFTDPMNLTYDILLDRSDGIYTSYNLQGMPVTFFVDDQGIIQSLKFGPLTEEELREKTQALFGEVSTDSPASSGTETADSGREIQTTNGTKHSVPLSDIKGGGPPKDGIPSIDAPKFVTVEEADEYLDDNGIGISISHNGVDRFYPNQITVWHEIVNDQIEDQAFLVTYCPLCGTGIVFDPTLDGEQVEFGTSGKLWNSNLVMYDRKSDTYWSQVLGEAIVGERTGERLALLPHDNLRWKDWKDAHPDGQVLSRDTGFFRDYSTGGPYGDYDTNTTVIFPVDNEDNRYHPKEPTWGLVFDDLQRVYPQSELEQGAGTFTETVGEEQLTVSYDKDNNTIDIRDDQGNEVVPFYGFWFSWIAVHPDSEVYTAQ